MSITTSQQIQKYFSLYQNSEVTFTKEIIKALKLIPSQIYFKSLGNHWPCLIYSTSMSQVRILATLNDSFYEQVKKSGNNIQIRFAFKREGKLDPITFFIAAKISGFTPYGKSDKDINFIAATYTQRPPDSFIEIIGNLLDATANSQKRHEERVVITPDSAERIGLKSKDATVLVDSVPRKCIIRDLSFGGAKILLIGLAKFLIDKPAMLQIQLEGQTEFTLLHGKIVRNEEVSGRKDIAALAIQYDDEKIPVEYKMALNQFFKHFKIKELGRQEPKPPAHSSAPSNEGK
ncbi:MAG: PilZ domain-containing protein [Spirochaetaceae bacterium]|nr:MAG: PilZ domain-containing protein [Spirochaetaceae bacterium]